MAKILTIRILVNDGDADDAHLKIERFLEAQKGIIDFIFDKQDDAPDDTNQCLAAGTYVSGEAFDSRHLVIFSASEARVAQGAGFWSNTCGWTTMDKATKYSSSKNLNLPMSRGDDVVWMRCPYGLTYYGLRLIEDGSNESIMFECFAENFNHAREQAQNSYPGCRVSGNNYIQD